MLSGRADQQWLIGGALAAVALVAAGWFLLIQPANQQTASIQDQVAQAQAQQTKLRSNLTKLQDENTKLSTYQAERDQYRAALPTTADLTNFLRNLQTGDGRRGVVTSVQVSDPVAPKAGGGSAYALPVTVTAAGSARQLAGLLDYLQQEGQRAVLIKSVDLDAGGGSGGSTSAADELGIPGLSDAGSNGSGGSGGSIAANSKMTISLEVYVAATVPAATPAPSPTHS